MCISTEAICLFIRYIFKSACIENMVFMTFHNVELVWFLSVEVSFGYFNFNDKGLMLSLLLEFLNKK